jgi:hypothetical protein
MDRCYVKIVSIRRIDMLLPVLISSNGKVWFTFDHHANVAMIHALTSLKAMRKSVESKSMKLSH